MHTGFFVGLLPPMQAIVKILRERGAMLTPSHSTPQLDVGRYWTIFFHGAAAVVPSSVMPAT